MTQHPAILFCDFDGTITEKSMVDEVGQVFVGQAWLDIKQAMLEGRVSLLDGVARAFALIPSYKKPEILEHVKRVTVFRTGFQELLHYCKSVSIPFIVASGGMDFFVDLLLAPYRDLITQIYSIESDFSGPFLRLVHRYACGQCGLCKVKVMGLYPGPIHVLVGDGLTDLHGARHADLVFARSLLATRLDQAGVSYRPFESFLEKHHNLHSIKITTVGQG
jgi:2-hydroxy-3-keto-5-methylthiopentenyl-1-phosphate phosphatase